MSQVDIIVNRVLKLTGPKDNEFFFTAVNNPSVFKVTLNFTNYVNHNITITAKKFIYDGKSQIDTKKVYSAKYEMQELKQLSPFFNILNTIFDMFKEIIFIFKENSVEIYDNINGVTIIITAENFKGLYWKIPFLLLPKIEVGKKNEMNESSAIESKKTGSNNIEEMIGKKRTRHVSENIGNAENEAEKTKL